MKITAKLWIGLGVLILLVPLGLLLPEKFKAGAAWGEWSIEEIEKIAGFVPQSMKKISGLWNAPIPDYVFKGWEEKGLPRLSLAYIISAITGIILVVLAVLLIGRLLAKKGD